MSNFAITLPDHFDLPTSYTKLVNAMRGLVVTLHPSDEIADDEGPVTVYILGAAETGLGNEVKISFHPWDAELDVDYAVTKTVSWELVGSITVH